MGVIIYWKSPLICLTKLGYSKTYMVRLQLHFNNLYFKRYKVCSVVIPIWVWVKVDWRSIRCVQLQLILVQWNINYFWMQFTLTCEMRKNVIFIRCFIRSSSLKKKMIFRLSKNNKSKTTQLESLIICNCKAFK